MFGGWGGNSCVLASFFFFNIDWVPHSSRALIAHGKERLYKSLHFDGGLAGPGKPTLTIYKWFPHVCAVDDCEGVGSLLEACFPLNTTVHVLATHLKGKSIPEYKDSRSSSVQPAFQSKVTGELFLEIKCFPFRKHSRIFLQTSILSRLCFKTQLQY